MTFIAKGSHPPAITVPWPSRCMTRKYQDATTLPLSLADKAIKSGCTVEHTPATCFGDDGLGSGWNVSETVDKFQASFEMRKDATRIWWWWGEQNDASLWKKPSKGRLFFHCGP